MVLESLTCQGGLSSPPQATVLKNQKKDHGPFITFTNPTTILKLGFLALWFIITNYFLEWYCKESTISY